ncbi:MAG: hypothetical protein ACR2H2_09040 [Solirubrobacteraceae bacterium]
MADAGEIVILNTWIPGLDLLEDSLADALARGLRRAGGAGRSRRARAR